MSRPSSTVADTQLLRIRGHRIAVRVQGEGDPLLLINGITRPLQSWDPLTRELPGRTLVSFDAPGVGRSSTPLLPMSISGLAHLAAAVLDATGLDSGADVLGFSHGGAVAQQLAAEAPHQVRRLILVATSCGIGATPGTGSAMVGSLEAPGDATRSPQASALGLLWGTLALSCWSSVPFLGALRAPTLVVSGLDDRVVPPENARLLARRIPRSSLVLLPGGHDLQRPDRAGPLARTVEDFLSDDSARVQGKRVQDFT